MYHDFEYRFQKRSRSHTSLPILTLLNFSIRVQDYLSEMQFTFQFTVYR